MRKRRDMLNGVRKEGLNHVILLAPGWNNFIADLLSSIVSVST